MKQLFSINTNYNNLVDSFKEILLKLRDYTSKEFSQYHNMSIHVGIDGDVPAYVQTKISKFYTYGFYIYRKDPSMFESLINHYKKYFENVTNIRIFYIGCDKDELRNTNTVKYTILFS